MRQVIWRFCWISILVLAILAWMMWSNSTVMIETIPIVSRRLPPAFSGYRIAQVSDLHNAVFGKENQPLLELLEKSDPDCIVLTGDLVDCHHTDVPAALDFVKDACQIAPVYYVSGNHEAYLDLVSDQYQILKEGMQAYGVTILENEGIVLPQPASNRSAGKALGTENRFDACNHVVLAGLSDPGFVRNHSTASNGMSNAQLIQSALDQLEMDETSYSIVLAHHPELFETYVQNQLDLVLSGHAHGGQFRFPFIGGLYAPNQGFWPDYDAGLYSQGQTNMVVSRGLGNSEIPIRFNNQPEVVLIELTHPEMD